MHRELLLALLILGEGRIIDQKAAAEDAEGRGANLASGLNINLTKPNNDSERKFKIAHELAAAGPGSCHWLWISVISLRRLMKASTSRGSKWRPRWAARYWNAAAVVRSVYDRGPYRRVVDYREPPPPPALSEAEAAWVDAYLRERGLREEGSAAEP